MKMSSDLPLYESEINKLVKEYLSFAGLEKALYSLQLECNEKGKSIPPGNDVQGDGSKLTAQNNILLEFDSANFNAFWALWEQNVPNDIRNKDQTCQRLEFYIHIHFAVYPIRVGSVGANSQAVEQAMMQFKKYLETKGSDLSQTTEFLPFYALPFVPNPVQHPSFKEIFSTYWVPDLRARVDKFLTAALSATDPPLLITLVKNKGRLSVAEDASEQATKTLQQHLIQAEKRCSAYMKRFNKLQADYHTLISITAELVDSLEQTVHGKMVTVEYLQQICARLFSGRSVAASINTTSIDFTRPGTASSILRASVAPDSFVGRDESHLLPSLDFNKIISHLQMGSDRLKAFLLQALRWRLTRSSPGEQRDTVLLAYIENDIFQCNAKHSARGTPYDKRHMLRLFESYDVVVKQYAARLYNALASLQKGRAYLCEDPDGIGILQKFLWRGRDMDDSHNATDHVFEEHLLGCLQKLSLRRPLQTVMIRGGLIRWLVTILSEHDSLSDYMLEYAVALLMNLCLRTSGKQKCGEDASLVLKVLSDLLGHENLEIRPYVNGALYSVLSNPVVREEARGMGLEAILRDSMEGEQEEFKRQLEFIIKQLNKTSDEEDVLGESDDEGDEDDDEDQDAMEADLDKDEIIQPRPNEFSGEQLLCSDYLGIMFNSEFTDTKLLRNPAVESLAPDSGIPTRPTTPSHQRGALSSRDPVRTPRNLAPPLGESYDTSLSNLRSSYTNNLVLSSTMGHNTRPTSNSGNRPPTRTGSRGQVTPRSSRPASSDKDNHNGKINSARSTRSRQLPIDQEASILMSQLTGVERHLSLPAQNNLTLPTSKEGSTEAKEYMSAFSSRPRITRTPDPSGRSQFSSRAPPPNPTFSTGEPTSRPSSASSWRASKGSSSSVGDSRSRKPGHK
ncbi:unnamed protein product [Clavelina lepadiformis]|uniref:LisH domain-containing protein ARMC9 n=1 Tax=Clavelina lepadiformis TaxID=159417 RepID=A0ABP0FN64_CLALP